ncbi:MAG: PQQ-dependent sugar dehydrogenase [Rhodothermales bacterium]
MKLRKLLLVAVPVLALAALPLVLGFTPFDDDGEVHESERHSFTVETVAEGLGLPWGMAFLPDGRMLVTEKEGAIKVVSMDGTTTTLEGTPEVCFCGQGGMLDVELHPNFATNRWVYLTYSHPIQDGDQQISNTVLVRAKLSDDATRLTDMETLFQAEEDTYTRRPHHYGSRIVFDAEGYVYFSIGDRGQQDHAQDLSRPNGKLHRLHDDGRIPADNPFVNQADALPSIWTYGNRNPQGVAVHPDGSIWSNEHGPRGGDELNHMRSGVNYGWPTITYGINYNGTPITDIVEKEGMEQPVHYWLPSIAVSGLAFYDGDAFSKWQGDALVVSLAKMELQRLDMHEGQVMHVEVVMNAGDRIRAIEVGPDGNVYLAMESDKIVRLVPAEA